MIPFRCLKKRCGDDQITQPPEFNHQESGLEGARNHVGWRSVLIAKSGVKLFTSKPGREMRCPIAGPLSTARRRLLSGKNAKPAESNPRAMDNNRFGHSAIKADTKTNDADEHC